MSILKDLRQTLRILARHPAYSLFVVAILALTIGANAAIFTLIYGILLRPLPYPQAERLVSISEANPSRGVVQGASPPNYRDWQREASQFESITALSQSDLVIKQGEIPHRLRALQVTPGFLEALGTPPEFGRAFERDDAIPSQSSTVIVSHAFWEQFLHSDPQPLGRSLETPAGRLTVIGVLGQDFYFPDPFDLLIPLAFSEPELTDSMRGARYLQVVGKLAEKVSPEQGGSELDSITSGSVQNQGWRVQVTPLQELIVGDQRSQLLLLAGAVGFLLLVACANIGGLALSRMNSRSREFGLKAALGASRRQLVRQILTEMTLLFVAGGLCGVILASWTLDALLLLAPRELPRTQNLSLGAPVLLFTLLLSVACGLIFGLVPALRSTNFRGFDLSTLNTRSVVGPSLGSRKFLVVAEVALSLVLLVSAGLLTRSLLRLQAVDPGFRPEGAVTFSLAFPDDRYGTDLARLQFVQQMCSRIEALPQVESAAGSTNLPLSGSNMSFGFRVPGFEDVGEQFAQYHATTAGYFQTMGIPILRGREFSREDRPGSPLVALVNDSLADRYWPAGDAVGKRIQHSSRSGLQERTIVGVVKSVKHSSLDSDSIPEIYVPYAQDAWNFLSFVVRFAPGQEPNSQAIREQVWALDSNLPLDRIDSLEAWTARSQAPLRFRATLLLFFAGVSLLLACTGIYAVLSYLVSQNIRNIGVRMALGAGKSQILGEILRRGLELVAIGIVLGLLGSTGVAQLLAGFLFRVQPLDPLTLVSVTLLFLAASTLACLIPAGRATTIDPAIALRQE